MFREYDLRYLIPYVMLLLSLTGSDIWYEVAYRTEDSWPETIVSIGQGVSSAVAVTFTIFATVEGMIYMVLAMGRLKQLKKEVEEKEEKAQEALKKGLEEGLTKGLEKGREEGREEGRLEGREEGRQEERRRWEAWAKRGEEARASGQPFDEPPPSSGDKDDSTVHSS